MPPTPPLFFAMNVLLFLHFFRRLLAIRLNNKYDLASISGNLWESLGCFKPKIQRKREAGSGARPGGGVNTRNSGRLPFWPTCICSSPRLAFQYEVWPGIWR